MAASTERTATLVQSGSYQSGLLLWIKWGGAGGTIAAALRQFVQWRRLVVVVGDLASWNPECGETLWWRHGRGGNGGCDGDGGARVRPWPPLAWFEEWSLWLTAATLDQSGGRD